MYCPCLSLPPSLVLIILTAILLGGGTVPVS